MFNGLRILTKRRKTVSEWLTENKIESLAAAVAHCNNEDWFMSKEFEEAIVGELAERNAKEEPVDEATIPVDVSPKETPATLEVTVATPETKKRRQVLPKE